MRYSDVRFARCGWVRGAGYVKKPPLLVFRVGSGLKGPSFITRITFNFFFFLYFLISYVYTVRRTLSRFWRGLGSYPVERSASVQWAGPDFRVPYYGVLCQVQWGRSSKNVQLNSQSVELFTESKRVYLILAEALSGHLKTFSPVGRCAGFKL